MKDAIDDLTQNMYEAYKKIRREVPDQQATSDATTRMVRDAQLGFEKANRELELEKEANKRLQKELEALRATRTREDSQTSD